MQQVLRAKIRTHNRVDEQKSAQQIEQNQHARCFTKKNKHATGSTNKNKHATISMDKISFTKRKINFFREKNQVQRFKIRFIAKDFCRCQNK